MSHTDPYLSLNILKIVDVFKLQVSLFMYDADHNVYLCHLEMFK